MTKEVEKFKWGKAEIIDIILSILLMSAMPFIPRLLHIYEILG